MILPESLGVGASPATPAKRSAVWKTVISPALREPVGRIHWAGTETADEHIGYITGAIQSGERAAGEIVKQLKS